MVGGIGGHSVFFENFGKQGMNGDQWRAISQAAFDLECVREHHGTIDVQWSPELEQVVTSV